MGEKDGESSKLKGGSAPDFASLAGAAEKLDTLRRVGIVLMLIGFAVFIAALPVSGTERLWIMAAAGLLVPTGVVVFLVGVLRGDRGKNDVVPANQAPSVPGAVVANGLHAFFSTPMAALDDDEVLKKHRKEVRQIIDVMKDCCAVTDVFYAADEIESRDNFEDPGAALGSNWDKLKACGLFIMYLPEKKSSSCSVEAGLALALGKACIFFVPNKAVLPFILQGAGNAGGHNGLPRVKIFEGVQTFEDVIKLCRTNKKNLMSF